MKPADLRQKRLRNNDLEGLDMSAMPHPEGPLRHHLSTSEASRQGLFEAPLCNFTCLKALDQIKVGLKP